MPPRYAAKRDTSEAGIVEALEGVGAHVIKLNDRDVCDLIALYRGALTLIECKTGAGKLRPGQEAFVADMARHGVTVHVVRTPAEALDAIGFTWKGTRQ